MRFCLDKVPLRFGGIIGCENMMQVIQKIPELVDGFLAPGSGEYFKPDYGFFGVGVILADESNCTLPYLLKGHRERYFFAVASNLARIASKSGSGLR